MIKYTEVMPRLKHSISRCNRDVLITRHLSLYPLYIQHKNKETVLVPTFLIRSAAFLPITGNSKDHDPTDEGVTTPCPVIFSDQFS